MRSKKEVSLVLSSMTLLDANLITNYLSAFVYLVDIRCTKSILIVDLFLLGCFTLVGSLMALLLSLNKTLRR